MSLAFDSYAHRHTGVRHTRRLLDPNPKLTGVPATIAAMYATFADALLNELADGPELTEALRKLWESKNSAIMQHVIEPKL